MLQYKKQLFTCQYLPILTFFLKGKGTNISIYPRIKGGKIPIFGTGHHGHTQKTTLQQYSADIQNTASIKAYRQRLAQRAGGVSKAGQED